jgi:hypothetical protein
VNIGSCTTRVLVTPLFRHICDFSMDVKLEQRANIKFCVKRTVLDGQKTCPKPVEFYSKNKFEKLVHLVGFIIRNLWRTFGYKK